MYTVFKKPSWQKIREICQKIHLSDLKANLTFRQGAKQVYMHSNAIKGCVVWITSLRDPSLQISRCTLKSIGPKRYGYVDNRTT